MGLVALKERVSAGGGSAEADAALVAKARDGDVAAFESLYRRNTGRVYALCLRLGGCPSRAEELTQEAFIRAWQKLNTFRGDSAFSTWLHRLTVNLFLNEQRARQRRLDAASLEDSHAAAAVSGGRPDMRMDLETAIAQLAQASRTVFVLHDVEGYRHDEIAEMTGTAVGTSKAHLHRARKRLREVLTQ